MRLHESIRLLTIRDHIAIEIMARLATKPIKTFKDESWFSEMDSVASMWRRAYALADAMEEGSRR